MDFSHAPRNCGVYAITCIPNGKVYIGSSIDIRDRLRRHVLMLNRGNHHNPHLQAAWAKYGSTSFTCAVLDLTEPLERLNVEQRWIDKTKCWDRENGFNVFEIAGAPGEHFAQEWKGFIDPAGKKRTIVNLFRFCHENNLDFPSMHRLAKGQSKLKSYKGWTHINSVRKREYVKIYAGFIAPTGEPIGIIMNLAAFCREHGLDPTHMVAVAKGRILSHRGWRHKNGRSPTRVGPAKTYQWFVNPEGQHIQITNLKSFSQLNGLDVKRMYELARGSIKQHKGWIWRPRNGQI